MAWYTKKIRLGDGFPEIDQGAADQTVTIIPMNWLPIATAKKLMANMNRMAEIEQGSPGDNIDEQMAYADRAMTETTAMFAETLPLVVTDWTLADDEGLIPAPKQARDENNLSFASRVPANILQWIMSEVMGAEGDQEIPPTNASPSNNTSSDEAKSTDELIAFRPSLPSPVGTETNESALPALG